MRLLERYFWVVEYERILNKGGVAEFEVERFHDLFLPTTEFSNRSAVVEASQMRAL